MNASPHTNEPPKRAIASGLTWSCDTLEDWLASARPPVRDGRIDNCLAVIQDDGPGSGAAGELLAVTPENRLLYLRPAASPHAADTLAGEAAEAASEAGWTAEAITVPDSRRQDRRWPRGDVYQVAGFARESHRYVLVHYEEKTSNPVKRRYIEPMVLDPRTGRHGTWRLPGDLAITLLGTAQTEIFIDRGGRPLLYGKPTGFSGSLDVFAIVFPGIDKPWDTAQARFPERPGKPATFRLLANDDPRSLGTLLRLGDGNVVEHQRIRLMTPPDEDPYLEYDRERWQRRELTAFGGGNLDAARLTPLPERPGSFLLHAADGHVWLVSGFESAIPSVTCLTRTPDFDQKASQVRVSLDTSGSTPRVAVYIVDASPDRRIWVARERPESRPERPAFASWVLLGEQVRALAPAPRSAGGAGIFLVTEGKGTAIERRSFDPGGQAWYGAVVETTRASLDEAVKTSTHTARLALHTESGGAAWRAAVDLEASFPCVAVVNGVARHLAPGRRVRAFADDGGQVLVRVPTDGPDAPVLTAVLPASGRSFQAPLDEGLTRRLAGKEEHHRIDPSRLTRAGLLPEKLPEEARQKLTALVRDAGREIGRRRTGAPWLSATGGRPRPRWYYGALDTMAEGEPTWSVRTGTGSLPRELFATAANKPRIVIRDRPVEGWGFIGDMLSWFISTGQKLVHWAVQFGQNVARFILELGDKIFELAVDLAQGIVRGVQAIFSGIAAALGRVLDAGRALLDVVKAAFDPGSIRRTNECLVYCLNGGLSSIERLVREGLGEVFNGVVDKVVQSIDQPLGDLEGLLRGLTVGGLSAQGLPDKEDGTSGVPGRAALLAKAGIPARWVSDRVAAHPDRLQRALVVDDQAAADGIVEKLRKLLALVKSDDPNKETLLKITGNLARDLEADLKEGRIAALALLRLLDLSRRLLRLGGEILKAAVGLVLELVAEALAQLRKLLQREVRIPGVDQLAHLVLGRPLRISDLLTLMIAVPTTILWKIVTLGEEPFSQERADALLRSGLFGSSDRDGEDTAPQAVPVLNFLVSYLIWQTKKLVGQDDPYHRGIVRQHADEFRSKVAVLVPVATVLSFAQSLGSFVVALPMSNLTDTADSVSYGAGSKTIGWVGKIFTLVAVLMAAVGIYLGMVQEATMALLPDTPEGKKWLAQRQYVQPLDWVALSWVPTVVFGIVGFLCLTLLDPLSGGLANLGLNVLLGLVLGIGSIVYLALYIERNKPRIRGWKIAKEIGALVGAVPGALKWIPAIIFASLGGSGGLSFFALPPYLLVYNAGTIVATITATGSLIDENMAKRWSDFKAA